MRTQVTPLLNIFNSLIREGFEKFGRYYSSYRGIVSNVDDPDKFGRVKVVVPQVTGKFELDYWAWPKGNFSGKGYGSQVIPQKGDMVWVSFEMGNPRKPLWEHGHFSFRPDGKTPEKPTDLGNVKNFWFKTPNGHIIEFDDENGRIVLTPNDVFLVGDKNVTEKAVLGNKLVDKLEELCDAVKTIATNAASITVPTAVGPSGVPANASNFIQVNTEVTALKAQLEQILSEVMKLK